MSDKQKFVQLDNFEDEAFLRLKLEVTGRVLHGLFELELSFPGNVEGREEVRDEAEEDWKKQYNGFHEIYHRGQIHG